MLRRLPLILSLICLFLVTSGCAINRATAQLSPGTDLSKVKSFYIVEELKDKGTWNVYKLIETNLKKRGYTVTSGPEIAVIEKPTKDIQSPYKSDVVVTYVDKWMWDMTNYMLELTITFIDATSNLPMARGNSFHTSLTRKSPEEMVDEVLTNIFSAKSSP